LLLSCFVEEVYKDFNEETRVRIVETLSKENVVLRTLYFILLDANCGQDSDNRFEYFIIFDKLHGIKQRYDEFFCCNFLKVRFKKDLNK